MACRRAVTVAAVVAASVAAWLAVSARMPGAWHAPAPAQVEVSPLGTAHLGEMRVWSMRNVGRVRTADDLQNVLRGVRKAKEYAELMEHSQLEAQEVREDNDDAGSAILLILVQLPRRPLAPHVFVLLCLVTSVALIARALWRGEDLDGNGAAEDEEEDSDDDDEEEEDGGADKCEVATGLAGLCGARKPEAEPTGLAQPLLLKQDQPHTLV